MPTKLLYIHGLAQSGRSATAKFFEDVLNDVDVIAPDLSADPYEALGQLKLICAQENPDFVYAAQSAGVLALHIHDLKRIIVNPFTELSKSLQEHLGECEFMYPRRDGIQKFAITPVLISHFAELENIQFDNMTEFDKDNTNVFFLEIASDENNYYEFSKYFSNVEWIAEKEGVDAHMNLLRKIVNILSAPVASK